MRWLLAHLVRAIVIGLLCLSLIGVLGLLSGVAFLTSVVTGQASHNVRVAALAADADTRLARAIDMQEESRVQFWASHTPDAVAQFNRSSGDVRRALHAAVGTSAAVDAGHGVNDTALGNVQRDEQQYVALAMRFFGERGAGADARRHALEVGQIAPLLQRMQAELRAIEARAQSVAEQALGALHDQQNLVRDACLVVFPLGIALVSVFWVMRLRAERLRTRVKSLEQAALTDPITGVGNHRAFQEELRRQTSAARRHGHALALALVDVDEFKLVNDEHGHAHGDNVLTRLAAFLQSLRAEDRAFRLGGDEFALLLPYTNEMQAMIVLQRLRQEVERALSGPTISIGLAILHAEEPDFEMLRDEADAALYEAKRRGRNDVVSFEQIRGDVAIVSAAKIAAARQLIADRAISVAFQPIWDLTAGRVIAYEALMRPHSGYGLAGPADVFDSAERMGRAHVLDALCRDAIFARAPELPPGSLLFLNVAPQTLDHDMLAGDTLVRAVLAAGLDPSRVVLEITERAMPRLPVVIREARRLQSLGFRIALDDVGAGNAGLEVLRQLPVDFVKVDRSVISAALDDPAARGVLAGILAFAGQTKAFVIAEGIETMAMLEFSRHIGDALALQVQGVQGAQGYYLGRPSETIQTPATDAGDGAGMEIAS